MKFENVIFDLGNVFIPLNMDATVNAFEKLGASNFEETYSYFKQESFFDHFDRGQISDIEFRNEMRKYLRNNVSDAEIDNAWNAMLNPIPKSKIDFINSIKQKYNLFLLSNTNVIHINCFLPAHNGVYGDGHFESLFQKIYFSSDIGMRKPDAEIYEFVIQDSQLIKSKTIFIDDSIQHVKGALNIGLQAFHLNIETHNIELLFEQIS